MASQDELACVYAALILADDQVAVTSDKLATILKAAGVSVEPYWPSLFAKALEGVSIKDLVSNIGSPSAGGPAVAAAADTGAAGAAPAAEAKKEDKKAEESESDEDMGFGLFD